MHVKEDDKSITSLLPSQSETEATVAAVALIMTTFEAHDDDDGDDDDAIDRFNEKITSTHAHSIDSVVKTKAIELLMFRSIFSHIVFMNGSSD